MSYVPSVPVGGYAGWAFLQRTYDKQLANFTAASDVQRKEDYFREWISTVSSAAELVSDRRLLEVALGAFGLDDDIDNKYFIQRVLEEGSLTNDALAHKLSDKRYLALTVEFGFGDYNTPRTILSDFADRIIASFEARQFERAVGEIDQGLRLALNANRELPEVISGTASEKTKWFSIIGSDPLASVFRSALGLPEAVSALDVDQQVTIYQEKTRDVFGSSDPGLLEDAEQLQSLVQRMLLNRQLSDAQAQSSGSIALQLLKVGATPAGLTLRL
ncbi:DUF1217 domain-containing protein [Pseudothioclava arenosa]|uniref:Flagellar protein n=1 Tax=Pseudothioclava arenosa TaxID=1795308 RepID=A0A2A4CQK7_9RHOB|nr:DUF1217 domain-containing protein [Pseudothioclava arenosa]PCD76568.1 flagellar protein [Pseudothioclava arenosa]